MAKKLVEDGLVEVSWISQVTSDHVTPVNMQKPTGNPFRRNEKSLEPQKLVKKCIWMCGDLPLSKQLTAGNIICPTLMILADILYLLHTKDQNFNTYKSYDTELWMQCGACIKRLHSDHEGQYLSIAFDEHLSKSGTLQSLTVHDMPKYNGVSEQLNHMLLEKVQAMLHPS